MAHALLPRGTAVLDLARQDLEQRGVVPRLLDEAARAAAHRLDRGVDGAPAGHHDDREVRIETAGARDEVQAFASRRGVARVIEVGEQQLVGPLLQVGEGGVGRGDEVGIEVGSFQQEPQCLEHIRLVVGHQ